MIYDDILLCKTKGKVVDLEEKASRNDKWWNNRDWSCVGQHMVPNDVNSHPHLSNSGDLVIIHNGIIENYAPLK
jgi:glucosamine--fructose-6-phosphate aminotransferase (isomerizing)